MQPALAPSSHHDSRPAGVRPQCGDLRWKVSSLYQTVNTRCQAKGWDGVGWLPILRPSAVASSGWVTSGQRLRPLSAKAGPGLRASSVPPGAAEWPQAGRERLGGGREEGRCPPPPPRRPRPSLPRPGPPRARPARPARGAASGDPPARDGSLPLPFWGPRAEHGAWPCGHACGAPQLPRPC